MSASPAPLPRPFVKWPGGKRAILPSLLPLFPTSYGEYFEPFAGGGAVLLALNPPRATIRDVNAELITAYLMVRGQPEELILRLQDHERNHRRDLAAAPAADGSSSSKVRFPYYYRVRDQDPASLPPLEVAARFIYLNRTCFNGLYRVNRAGKFNVPAGSYRNPSIADADNLRAVSERLKRADIAVGDFQTIHPRRGDFVYLDPPYDPLEGEGGGASFTAYTPGVFGRGEQLRLRDYAVALTARGVHVRISNHDTPFIREAYADGFTLTTVMAPRPINSKGSGRGAVAEVLIANRLPSGPPVPIPPPSGLPLVGAGGV